jgi:hypothetical protein
VIRRHQRIRATGDDDRRLAAQIRLEQHVVDALAHAVGHLFYRTGERRAGHDVATFDDVAVADRAVERKVGETGRGRNALEIE